MSEVACVFGPALEEVVARGVPAEELVAGLGVHPDVLGNPRKRISWDAFTELIRRTSERLGPGVLEDLAALTTAQAVPPLLRGLLASWGDTRAAFRMGARWWGPWIFRSTRAHCELLSDGRLREVIEILPGFRESPEFFQGVRGLLRATPLMFGQPEAVVELEHDGRRGEFLIAPPPARERLGWRRRAAARVLTKARPNGGTDAQQLRASESRVKFATFLLAEKSRRLETLQVLGGLVTRHRGMRERAAAVVGLLEDELGVRGIRLGDHVDEDTQASELWTQSGDISGLPSTTNRLAVAGRTVGWLELWARSEGGLRADDRERLDDLLPWIALALDDARTAEEAGHLTGMLLKDAVDWQREERALERALPHGLRPGEGRSGDGAGATPEPSVAILVVEDDAELRARARREFEAAGHEVFEAPSDPGALALQGPAVPIQLVVADWSSHALSPEFVRQVRRLHPELRGLLLLPLRQP